MSVVLVDLDGTVTDPAPGIIAAFRHALLSMTGLAPPAEELRWVIGPPLRRSFPQVLPPGSDVEEALRLYRAQYAAGGLYEATVHAGMAQALEEMRARGDRLFVCTSKAVAYAPLIVEHFGLLPLFEQVYGAELDGTRDDKGELIAWMIEREGIDPRDTVMIGDRLHDVHGAAANGIPTVGVLWGYGSREELEAAGAAALAVQPAELPALVRSVAGKMPKDGAP